MGKIKLCILKCWQYDIVHTFVYSVLLNMIIECLNTRSLIGLVMIVTNPIIFLYNSIIIMLTMSVALICKRKLFVYGVVGFLWLLLAAVNFIVLYSRKTPFTAMDIYLIDDAIKVIPVYLNIFQMILIGIALMLAIAGLVVLFVKGPKDSCEIKYPVKLVKIGIIGAVIYYSTNLFLASGFLSRNFGNLANAYKTYGFVYSFSCSVVSRGISKEDDYSAEYISSLKDTLDNDEIVNSEKSPNIIFLQLESFIDPNLIEGVEYSQNPVPEFERLYKEYSSGYLNVPVFGAGTANTEFEVQTGMNMDDFGPGEYPYKTILQTKVCESMAFDLRDIGYTAHALHDNDGTFYDRYKIFSHLGYNTFTSVEYMDNVETTPLGWAKDQILVDEIGKILDSTEGSDYIYAISVQGHGDYPEELPDMEYAIEVNNFFSEENENAFKYYINQIYEMDQFIEELVGYLNDRDEETVLVMYGDHLPGFDFSDSVLKNKDIYQTQYIVWDNIGMDKEDKNVEAYQLSSYVLGRLGINNGYINKFHQQQMESEDYLKNLKILEYDMLYGNCDIYDGKTPFVATQLKMGIDDIIITSEYNLDNCLYVEGKNFNKYSTVLINETECETEFINSNMLKVKDKKINSGDVVSVIQAGKDRIELSRVYKTYVLHN